MLGVFAKTLNGAKTRLQARLSPQEATAFYVASLADTLETAVAVHATPTLFVLGDDAEGIGNLHRALLGTGMPALAWDSCTLSAQRGSDLGERLANAFDALFANPASTSGALIIGSDSPTLGAARLRRGLDRLRNAAHIDVVLGPTADGGYYAVGLARPVPSLFEHIAWSTDRALADTMRQAARLGLEADLLEPWTDVDAPADLQELARQIAAARLAGDTSSARHSERFLAQLGISA